MTNKQKISLNGLPPLLDFLHARIVQQLREISKSHNAKTNGKI